VHGALDAPRHKMPRRQPSARLELAVTMRRAALGAAAGALIEGEPPRASLALPSADPGEATSGRKAHEMRPSREATQAAILMLEKK
jgi:hypothetical protein